MAAIKTAISVDVDVYRQVERLTRRLHISRSRFFTQAARHVLKRDENLDLLRRINAAHAAAPETLGDAAFRRAAAKRVFAKDAREW
jgi:metal-responsive CopG/Arc/MetJ family transcriptional regulator